MSALDPDFRGAARVRELFARVRNGDSRVADLYADNGVVVAGGNEIHGREEIRAFYQRTFDAIHPKPLVETILQSPPWYIAVVDVPTSAGRQRAIDLFELTDEGIKLLVIFSQSSAST
jgi:SnoaL-like domain